MKKSVSLLMLASALCCGGLSVRGQGSEDVVRIDTRVVFIDTFVKDRKTGAPIRDLARESFEVFDEGKPRPLSYFTNEKRPLALVLVLDLDKYFAGRFLRRPEIIQSLAAEIAQLPPEDEVAVMAISAAGVLGSRMWLSKFTRDRAQVAAALSIVPTLVVPDIYTEAAPQSTEPASKAGGAAADGGALAGTKAEAGAPGTLAKEESRSSINTSVNDKKADVGSDPDVSAIVEEVTRLAITERPNSQVAMVAVTDGLVQMSHRQRDEITAKLLQANVTFSPLLCDMRTAFKIMVPIFKPIGTWAGVSLYGSVQHIAKQTGGETTRVRRPEDYGAGLRQIVNDLGARYSIGFTLGEGEQNDGRLHRLEVRVKARDARGKERKLLVNTRRGYYLPKEGARFGTATNQTR